MSEPTKIGRDLSIEEEVDLELEKEDRALAKNELKAKKSEIRKAEKLLRQLQAQEKDILSRFAQRL